MRTRRGAADRQDARRGAPDPDRRRERRGAGVRRRVHAAGRADARLRIRRPTTGVYEEARLLVEATLELRPTSGTALVRAFRRGHAGRAVSACTRTTPTRSRAFVDRAPADAPVGPCRAGCRCRWSAPPPTPASRAKGLLTMLTYNERRFDREALDPRPPARPAVRGARRAKEPVVTPRAEGAPRPSGGGPRSSGVLPRSSGLVPGSSEGGPRRPGVLPRPPEVVPRPSGVVPPPSGVGRDGRSTVPTHAGSVDRGPTSGWTAGMPPPSGSRFPDSPAGASVHTRGAARDQRPHPRCRAGTRRVAPW